MYRIRVYYNRSQDFPFVWSYDKGDISTEKIVKDIKIFGCAVTSRFDSTKDNSIEPRAWFEVNCSNITVMNDVVYLS